VNSLACSEPSLAADSPMRILVISNCPLDPNQGSGYVILGYANRMRERGHEVVAYGIEHFTPLQRMHRLTRLRRLLGYAYATAQQTRTAPYDIVELWGAEGWLALLTLRLLQRTGPIPVSRSNGLETHWRTLRGEARISPLAWLRRMIGTLPEIAFRRCAALTVVSRFDARFALSRTYQPQSRLLVMENPLEQVWLGQLPCFERRPVIGFVGAWLPNKGSELLSDAIRKVLAAQPSTKFLLVGIGKPGVQALAKEFPGESRIQTVAFCPRAQIATHYQRMAVLMVPSFFESFGLVAAEAMSCGVALAATRTGFAADLDESEFAPIEERTPTGIAEVLVSLLRDDSHRQSLARAGHARVQALDWTSATNRLEDLYQSLLTPRRRKKHA
jgi:glycosyltransferase involved in cell wall biosynthesis